MSGSLRLLCNEVRNVYLPRTGSRSTPAPGLCFSVLSLDRNAPDVFACSGLVPACLHISPVIAAPPSQLSGPYRSPRSFRLLQKQLRAVPPLRFEASCQATAPATSCVLYWLGASRSAPSGRSGRSRVFHHHTGCGLHAWPPSRMHSGTPSVEAPDVVVHPVCFATSVAVSGSGPGDPGCPVPDTPSGHFPEPSHNPANLFLVYDCPPSRPPAGGA
ncbi:hypothetical protein C8R47DRAFT_1227002 [Mycena vitilis]|nr:hypothetical protein C8R47DRAFT_1227002 [Mycena vitilis]